MSPPSWIDGSSVGRNDPCPCGSGKKFKKCSCRTLVELLPARTSFPYGLSLSIEDIEPRIPATVEATLAEVRRYAGPELAQVLGRVNVFLADEHKRFGGPIEMGLAESLFPKRDVRRVLLWIETRVRHKLLVRDSLRALIQLAIVEDKDGLSLGDPQELRGLGFLVLRMNRVTHEPLFQATSSIVGADAKRFLILGDLFRTFFVQYSDSFGPALARYSAIQTQGLQAAAQRGAIFDFEAAFQKVVGQPYDLTMAVGFLVWSYYEQLRSEFPKQERPFALEYGYLAKIESEDVRSVVIGVLEYYSADWRTHVENLRTSCSKRERRGIEHPALSAYAPTIYSHPFVHVRGRGYFPLDLEYLASRLTEGVYWAVFDKLSDAEKWSLNGAFGYAAEWYVARILRASFRTTEERSVWLDWDGEFEADQKCTPPDAVVIEGDTAFIIEVTTVATSPSTATDGNWEKIEAGLKEQWFGGGGKRAKLLQLNNAANSILTRRVRAEGLDPDRIKTVYPMLVNLRTFPQTPPLTARYREIVLEKGLPESFVERLTFLDFSELEWLCSLRLDGKLWTKVLEDKRASDRATDSMHNYLSSSPYPWEWHPEVKEILKRASDTYSRLLFGDSGPEMD
jgi:hypothetical protein